MRARCCPAKRWRFSGRCLKRRSFAGWRVSRWRVQSTSIVSFERRCTPVTRWCSSFGHFVESRAANNSTRLLKPTVYFEAAVETEHPTFDKSPLDFSSIRRYFATVDPAQQSPFDNASQHEAFNASNDSSFDSVHTTFNAPIHKAVDETLDSSKSRRRKQSTFDEAINSPKPAKHRAAIDPPRHQA